jgi:hypothetical protein
MEQDTFVRSTTMRRMCTPYSADFSQPGDAISD